MTASERIREARTLRETRGSMRYLVAQAVKQGGARWVNPDAVIDKIAAQCGADWEPGEWEHWRHGGWYVGNLLYPNGACGCVSNNYADRKWRIACDPRPFDEQPTFRTRVEAAYAERNLITAEILGA